MLRVLTGSLLLIVGGCGDDGAAVADGGSRDAGSARDGGTTVDAGRPDAARLGPPAVPAIRASAWPEADALFRSDRRWLGGDAAYSVALAPDRTLWLFGDSFIARSSPESRSDSRLVRNSIAIQTGADPSTATIAFHWRDGGSEPASFVPEDGDTWHWPLHGIRTGDVLTLYYSRVAPTMDGGPFGFRADGTAVLRIDDAGVDPGSWEWSMLTPPSTPVDLIHGVSVALDEAGDHVYVVAVEEPGDHDLHLARYAVADFEAGDLSAAEWWDGAEYVDAFPNAPLLVEGQTELSLAREDTTGLWVETQTRGFGGTTIALRFAHAPEGPYTMLADAYRPPESDRADVFVYAAKAHRHLAGADLVATYASNHFDFATLVGDESLYYPRFVRIDFE